MNKFLLGVSVLLSSLVVVSTNHGYRKINIPKFANQARMPLKKEYLFGLTIPFKQENCVVFAKSRDEIILCSSLIQKGR